LIRREIPVVEGHPYERVRGRTPAGTGLSPRPSPGSATRPPPRDRRGRPGGRRGGPGPGSAGRSGR
jgi:hypothetical protein